MTLDPDPRYVPEDPIPDAPRYPRLTLLLAVVIGVIVALFLAQNALALDPRTGREGDIAHTGSRGTYLAIPLGPGVRVRICGPAACLVAVSTDAGPNREMLVAGRIADLDVGRWEQVCGVEPKYGLCPGSWVVVTGEPQMTLPPTDTAP